MCGATVPEPFEITDRGLRKFSRLKNLVKVYLDEMAITDAGLESVRKSRPNIQIVK